MAFTVPASKKSIKQNRFEFEVDGEKYDIPYLKFAPVASIEAFENERNVTGFVLMCDSDEAKAAIRSMDGEQLEAFMEAYQKESGVDVGESSASSSS